MPMIWMLPKFGNCLDWSLKFDWYESNIECEPMNVEMINDGIFDLIWCDDDDDDDLVDEQALKAPAIQDDADGHLIYRTGDILHNRCSW